MRTEKKIEELGRDKQGRVTSQAIIWHGKRICDPYRPTEKSGVWICFGGYSYDSRSEAKWGCYSAITAMQYMGFRVGKSESDGTIGYYFFKPRKFKSRIRKKYS